ncbi:odorant receptor Or2-like [Schistocerca gregaria]|uniref:odorant receptor Or2-like n=1 Tax=Schistocerca gregaria TaxID=7010 RepID=UPI00211F3DD4|nr:odorant receptor Or2-like [Schistocerca gregaria]
MVRGLPEDMGQPLSWADSGQSILKLNIRHLWFCGAWPLPGSWMFNMYGAFILVLGIWNAVESLLSLYFCWGDMDEMTMVFISTFTNACGTVKMVFFMPNRRHYYALARHVEKLASMQSEFCSADPVLADIWQGSQRRASRLTLGLLFLMFSQYPVWFPMPIIAQPEDRRLPFAQHGWDNNTNYYELSYVVQCVLSTFATQLSNGVDLLFATVMILTAAQMQILTVRIASLKTEYTEVKLEKGLSVMAYQTQNTCDDKMYEKLCQCIGNHQKILRFVKQLEKTMSSIAIMQFCFSVLSICVTLFQATYSTDFSSVLKCACYLPVPTGQIFLYCWGAHNITEQAEAVTLAAYSCSWLGASPRFKRALRILMCRAQKPLVLTAAHLYPMSREAFVSVVNASYSFYALLGQMNRR